MLTVLGDVFMSVFPPEELRHPVRSPGRPLAPLPVQALEVVRLRLPSLCPSVPEQATSSAASEPELSGIGVSFLPLQGLTVRRHISRTCSKTISVKFPRHFFKICHSLLSASTLPSKFQRFIVTRSMPAYFPPNLKDFPCPLGASDFPHNFKGLSCPAERPHVSLKIPRIYR